jgi:Right handed beta helix region
MGRILCAALAVAAFAPAVAIAHLERPSYWPDPRPDTTVSPPAGGAVPEARSLGSAVTGAGPGKVRVVCQGANGKKSLRLALDSIRKAENKGFRKRPSQPSKRLSEARADKKRRINRALADLCEFDSIQKAINKSGNNDRVVIMPGRYTEPASRRAPVNDPRCNPSELQGDQRGTPTPSYEYQAKCQNDQNLIHVTGRAVAGEPTMQPSPDRHGIPEQELGRCIRCNLQVEGSGARPEDVIIDAGRNYTEPLDPRSRPGGDRPASECLEAETNNPCFAKHVVLRTDRSDGFVGRNFLLRGAREHGFYTEETDGILLARVKFFWNADYGHLSFTSDHHLVKNCEGFGSGDSVVYPGAAPQTGDFRDTGFYPDQRYNTTIKRCDLHGSAMGYSGSMGNSVRVTDNRFYGNANGLTTDTLSAPGHPGFPADGMKIDNNWFYANNLDVYRDDPPFMALVPQPVGTGFFWAGNNDGTFEDNWVFDNWRQGTMLISVPDSVAGEIEGNVDSEFHCPDAVALGVSTSCFNRYSGNHMSEVPPEFEPHPKLTLFGNQTTLAGDSAPQTAPNGVDFWWDQATTNIGNCWPDNTGSDGTRASLTANPPIGPVPGANTAGFLPEGCDATSIGNSAAYAPKAAVLLTCFAQWESEELTLPGCGWWDSPARPGSAAARAERGRTERLYDRLASGSEAAVVEEWVRELSGDVDLGP